MIRVLELYEQEPDPDRYQDHAELCRKMPGGPFRTGIPVVVVLADVA
jgi:hypothetical protein